MPEPYTQTRIGARAIARAIQEAQALPAEPASGAPLPGLLEAVEAARQEFRDVPGVVSIRPGFRRVAGRITTEPAVIVAISPNAPARDLERVRTRRETATRFPVDVVAADPRDILAPPSDAAGWRVVYGEGPAAGTAEAAEAAKVIGYKPPPKRTVQLEKCEVRDVLCHIGPDSGWTTLRSFLSRTSKSLTVAMYELTAPHVADLLIELAGDAPTAALALILQENADETETVSELESAWRNRFDYAKAVVSGPKRIFANSYHTKVAVRDGSAVWLSSGNWSPHSQPVVPDGPNPTVYRLGNREWHVVVEDASLARIFEKFIRFDLEQATEAAGEEEAAPVLPDLLVPEAAFLELEAAVVQPKLFEPKRFRRGASERGISVQPLMTPDNYGEKMLELIGSAKDSLRMQYSYIRKPADDDTYLELVKAVAKKMREGVDVRVIVDGRNEKDEDIDALLKLKWNRKRWRRQRSRVHNKGVIVDGHTTVVGSQNWSGDGTQVNRDASLIFEEAEDIAAYFGEVFEFDWSNLTSPIDDTLEIVPVIAEAGRPTPPGMVRVPWRAWYGD